MRGVPLIVLAAAGCGRLEQTPLLVRVFGPPTVELREAYATPPTDEVRLDHADLTALLAAHVHHGDVDYAGLARDEAALDSYLGRLAHAPWEALGRDEKLALLINAYNAFTLKLILEHRPLHSIKDIAPKDRWDAQRWTLGGRQVSLSQIEHEELRAHFAEPRIHFAINCASVGCPPLRAEAYDADRLEQQLDEQTRQLHADPRWVRVDEKTQQVHLTSLYLWYEGDFTQAAGSPLAYAARYRPALADGAWKVRWLDYDWRLNDSARGQTPGE